MSTTQCLMLSGPGLIGRIHARIIHENEDCDLAVIVAPDTKENRLVAQEFDAAFHSDFDAALDAERIDGVIISSPNPFHFSQAMTCIKRAPDKGTDDNGLETRPADNTRDGFGGDIADPKAF